MSPARRPAADRFDAGALDLLRAIARRGETARRLETGAERAVLSSIVGATVTLFDAEAASLALFDPARGQLVFVVAAGEQGQGVIGLAIAPDQGIAGYVFTTGQPLALSEVERDARFGRAAAEATGYVPRSVVAVPLIDERGTLGVLEVLDKRSSATFSLRDIELASVFARQATVAIRASRLERDLAGLLRTTLAGLADPDQAGSDQAGSAQAATIEQIVERATSELDGDDEGRLWAIVDRVARLRAADPGELELLTEILDVVARRAERRAGQRRRAGRGRSTG
ncbi:MAG TPA: GAF domain-containing protein [Candidatus Limnocylindrales bacterium]|nr:GAF domain-containing protein [Candidatus Limnocylindrales bacterium]